MTAVFEEVEEGHCGGGELVYKGDFEFAFEEVEGYEGAGEELRWGGGGGCVGVDVGTGEEEEDVDDEGAGVFDDEDCSP